MSDTFSAGVLRSATVGAAAAVTLVFSAVGAPPAEAGSTFNPEVAAVYARTHALDTPTYGADCTYFVSQALYVGGLDETARWNFHSTDPNNRGGNRHLDTDSWPTATATVADRLKNYLVNEIKIATIHELDWRVNEVPRAELGDIVAYDWNHGADGIIDHLSMVTGFSETNTQYPLVSQHTPEQRDRGWTWSETSETWIEHASPGARVYLIHFK